jgi:nitroreductase
VSMTVSEAIASRMSVRGFTETPVDPGLIRQILAKAARAATGGNLQPWHIYVVGGQTLADFKSKMLIRIQEAPKGDEPYEYDVYPKELVNPYRDRRYEVAEDMYALLGIAREDKLARLMWVARNFQFFDAPLALFCYVDRRMGPPQWSDLGMYLQNVMLLLREAGLDSCAQEAWSIHHKSVAELVGAPPELMLFAGMAIGYKDSTQPVNNLRSRRADLEEFATFVDV